MDPQDTVVGIHNTRLESLFSATRTRTGALNGNGILVDGRLRYGCCTHGVCSGVNVWSGLGAETFAGCTGWVSLEVRCTNTTPLKGGRRGGHCIRGPSGEV